MACISSHHRNFISISSIHFSHRSSPGLSYHWHGLDVADNSPSMASRTLFGPSSSIACCFILFNIWLLCVAAVIPIDEWTTLDFPFTLVNGNQSIILPAPGFVPSEPYLGTEPAIFTLKDGRLSSGDRFLARTIMRDHSNNPKPIYWWLKDSYEACKGDWVAAKHGDLYQLLNRGDLLILFYNGIRVDINSRHFSGPRDPRQIVVLEPVVEEPKPEY